MSTFSAPVLERLTADLPMTIPVIPYARTVDAPATPVLMARLDRIGPKGAGQWTADVSLILIGATTDPTKLEPVLAQVIAALDAGADGVSWTEATAATWEGSLPAYVIATTTVFNKE